MAGSTDRDYDRLCSLLKAVSLRHQLLGVLEFAIILASGTLLLILGSLALPFLSGVSGYLPFAYWAWSILFLAFLVWRGFRVLWPIPSLRRTARGLERAFAVLRDDVTNTILLVEQTASEEIADRSSLALIRAQLRQSVERVTAIRLSDAVTARGSLRWLVFLAPLAVTMAMVLFIDSPLVGRALALLSHPLSTIPATPVTISLGQKDLIVIARGTPVPLRFTVAGQGPDRLYVTVWPEGGEVRRAPAARTQGNTYSHTIESAAVSFRYQAATGRGDLSPVGTVSVVDPPDLESLKVSLAPPPYTGLRTATQTDGRITALNGTIAKLDITATKEITEGQILLGEQNRYPLTVDGRHLSGSLLVLQPGTYRIGLKDTLGFTNPDPTAYEIRVIPDKFPDVVISAPATDMEIAGDETIPVTYSANDDFGLSAIRLIYQVRGDERRIMLAPAIGRHSTGPDTFKWDLSTLALLPGESMTFRIEAEDNDTIAGPKKASSRSVILTVKDERKQASNQETDSQRIADALLDLLADQLEEKSTPEVLTKGMDRILDQVTKNLEKAADRPERFDLEALKRNLTSLKDRAGQEPNEKVTQELERAALLAEDITKGARMNEVEAMARELRNRQRQLIDAFREFKGPPTKEGLERLTSQLKKLEDLLRTVMDALSRLATRLPDEFVNSQELSGLEFQDMFGDLSEMYKRLSDGDVEGALEAARRMLQNLQEMMAALGRAGTRAGSSPSDRMAGEMAEQASELEKILAGEKEIYSETAESKSKENRSAEADTLERLGRNRPALEQLLESLRDALPEEERDIVASARRFLELDRIERLEAMLSRLEEQLRGSGDAEEQAREALRLTQGLGERRGGGTGETGQDNLSGLSERQQQLKGRTEAFLERLEALAQLFPSMDTAVLKDIEGAAGSMMNAAGRLKEADAAGALPPEEDAIRRLSKSQQAMQQMSREMAEAAGARMQAGNRWGSMVAYDPRPGWYYGPWMPMPTLPQPEVRFPREKGRTGIDREEFEPPSKNAYRVPQRFRERIMESMKQPVPQGYERDVEHYFRELAQ
jgi:hypothetical protein